jgi:hypothetical protein
MANQLIQRRRPQPAAKAHEPTPAQEATPTPAPPTPEVSHIQQQIAAVAQAAMKPVLRTTSLSSAVHRQAKAEEAKKVVEEHLKLIAKAERDIDAAQAIIQDSYGIIEHQLREHNLSYHSDGAYVAKIEEQWTRQQTIIHQEKFRNAVANEVFWNSITVLVTKAREFMTDKELAAVSDVVAAECKGTVLKVAKLEPKRRAKK